MKKIKYMVPILVSVLLLGTSCSEPEGTIYDQGDKQNALFQLGTLSFSLTKDAGGGDSPSYFTVKMYRGNTSQEANISISLDASAVIGEVEFTVPAVAHFKAGESVAEVVISYDFDKLGLTDVYPLVLSISNKDDVAEFGGFSSVKLSVRRKLTFVTVGTGLYESNVMGESWEQSLLVAEEDPTCYCLPDLYESGKDIIFVIKDGIATVAKQPAWTHATYGIASVEGGGSFDGKTLTLMLKHTVSAGSFGTFEEKMVLPD